MATKKKPSPAYAFALAALKRNPNASFADIAKRAKAKRISVVAIVYGKAKLDLGLVQRGQGIAKRKKAGARRGPGRPRKVIGRRGPGRPRKLATLDSIANQIRDLQADRDHAVDALNRIRNILGE